MIPSDIYPTRIWKTYRIYERSESLDDTGRAVTRYAKKGTLSGGLGYARADKVAERFGQLNHPITHRIIQMGAPAVKERDALVMDHRVFIIAGIENPGDLNVTAIYWVEERHDITEADLNA